MTRTATSGMPLGAQHYWAAMIALSRKGGFTIADVHARIDGRSLRTVKDYVRWCASTGAIVEVGRIKPIKRRTMIVYRVVNLRAAAPDRRDEFASDYGRRLQHIWTAMRVLRTFGITELAVAASTDTVTVSVTWARKYVAGLARAGYLVEVGTRTRIGKPACWRLLPKCNTGPLAPALIARQTALYDRNRKVSIPLDTSVGRAA